MRHGPNESCSGSSINPGANWEATCRVEASRRIHEKYELRSISCMSFWSNEGIKDACR